MTDDVVIRVDGVSKTFAIRQSSNSLRQFIGQIGSRRETQYKQALADISFEVKKGDRLGIIGGNGAGKSTLLKLMSKVLWPDTGRIELDGRLSAMLEVGTGFYPDLTGRENVFMSGSLLGMSRSEIKKSFDRIVDFADIGRYIDTPVRYYSSGMYVRLGFAINACLKQEIILIDEVLAVGDRAFKEKCITQINNEKYSGDKTYVIVSHNLDNIRQICNRVIHLDGGQLVNYGEPIEVINAYLRKSVNKTDTAPEDDTLMVEGSINGYEGDVAYLNASAKLDISGKLELQQPVTDLVIRVFIRDETTVIGMLNNIFAERHLYHVSGKVKFRCSTSDLSLRDGRYQLDIEVCDRHRSVFYKKGWKTIEVNAGGYFNSGLTLSANEGYVLWKQDWTLDAKGK